MAHDIFISHSSVDKPYADAAVAALEAVGLRCWIAPRDILPGSNYMTTIASALVEAKMVVLIFSSHSNSSEHVRREILQAVENGRPVLPLRIEEVRPQGPLSFALAGTHWLDALTSPMEQHLRSLTAAAATIVGSGTTEPPGSATKLGFVRDSSEQDGPAMARELTPPGPASIRLTAMGDPTRPAVSSRPARPLPRWRRRPPRRIGWVLWPLLSMMVLGWVPFLVAAVRRPTSRWLALAAGTFAAMIAMFAVLDSSGDTLTDAQTVIVLGIWLGTAALGYVAAGWWANEWWADADAGRCEVPERRHGLRAAFTPDPAGQRA